MRPVRNTSCRCIIKLFDLAWSRFVSQSNASPKHWQAPQSELPCARSAKHLCSRLARIKSGCNLPPPDQADVAQLVEQRFRKPQVTGSNPVVGSMVQWK